MKCKATQEMLTQYLLGDLSEAVASEIHDHLKECGGCRAEAWETKSTLDLLRNALAAPTEAPARLSGKHHLEIMNRFGKMGRRIDWWVTKKHKKLSLAAAAMVMVSVTWFLLSSTKMASVSDARLSAARARLSQQKTERAIKELSDGYAFSPQAAADEDASMDLSDLDDLLSESPGESKGSYAGYRRIERKGAARRIKKQPPTEFSPKPAKFDSVSIVESPVIMKNIHGSRGSGSAGEVKYRNLPEYSAVADRDDDFGAEDDIEISVDELSEPIINFYSGRAATPPKTTAESVDGTYDSFAINGVAIAPPKSETGWSDSNVGGGGGGGAGGAAHITGSGDLRWESGTEDTINWTSAGEGKELSLGYSVNGGNAMPDDPFSDSGTEVAQAPMPRRKSVPKPDPKPATKPEKMTTKMYNVLPTVGERISAAPADTHVAANSFGLESSDNDFAGVWDRNNEVAASKENLKRASGMLAEKAHKADEGRRESEVAKKQVPLEIDYPKAAFVGTPKNIKSDNLARKGKGSFQVSDHDGDTMTEPGWRNYGSTDREKKVSIEDMTEEVVATWNPRKYDKQADKAGADDKNKEDITSIKSTLTNPDLSIVLHALSQKEDFSESAPSGEEPVEVVSKVPILGDIPLLGKMFTSKRSTKSGKAPHAGLEPVSINVRMPPAPPASVPARESAEPSEGFDDFAGGFGYEEGESKAGNLISFGTMGLSANDALDRTEKDGRSNLGRQGMATGENASGSGTIGEGDKNVSGRIARGQKLKIPDGKTIVIGGMVGGTARMDSTEDAPAAHHYRGEFSEYYKSLHDVSDKDDNGKIVTARDRARKQLKDALAVRRKAKDGKDKQKERMADPFDDPADSEDVQIETRFMEMGATDADGIADGWEVTTFKDKGDKSLDVLEDEYKEPTPSSEIVTRMYNVLPSVGEKIAAAKAEESSGDFMSMGEPDDDVDSEDWKTFFEELGVKFPEGSTIKHVPSIGKLVVANTPDNLVLFEKTKNALNAEEEDPFADPDEKKKLAEAKEKEKQLSEEERKGPRFKAFGVNPFHQVSEKPFSTFAIDVDTASYTLSRNYMNKGYLPQAEAVRTEEFVNFFDYAYKAPARDTFKVYAECAPSKFGRGKHVLKIGVKGKRLGREQQRKAVLTFLIDSSGSMDQPDRLGLVKKSLKMLVEGLAPHDQVAIIQYDSHARVVLEHTPASKKKEILKVIDKMRCGGSTNLEEGMNKAYKLASSSFKGGGENRVLLLSDGVANLGTVAAEDILLKVEKYRKQGIYCSVFGVGTGNYDDEMLETLANKGDGTYTFVDSEDEAKRVFVDDLSATLNTIASDVKIQVEFDHEAVERYRQLGYENRQLKKEQFRDNTVDAGEVGSGQAVTALYELELAQARGQRSASFANATAAMEVRGKEEKIATVRVRYRRTDNKKVEEIEIPVKASDIVNVFDETTPRFKLAVCAAEFAEILRNSPHAKGSAYSDVSDVLTPVAMKLGLDKRVQEFSRLVNKAGSMPRATE